ncbi:MAG: ATP-binding protein [Candidatus Omnitrophota bacterium]
MKYELAKTKNVRTFLAVLNDLRVRPMGVEGMGILWGRPGEGKSTVLAYATNIFNGIFIRAKRSWTMTSLLEAIIFELHGVPGRRRSQMEDWIEKKLMEFREERIILVDEADYLFSSSMASSDMLDVLRDIYDTTGTPIILAGMENIARRIQEEGRFARRITSWVEFQGIDLDDARIVADTICEVGVADDLLAHLHRECKASIGNIVPALSRIENLGKTTGIKTVDMAAWGDRPLYFAQPKFRRQG